MLILLATAVCEAGRPKLLHLGKRVVQPRDTFNHSIPAGGDVWPVAIYWVNVSVGTPPKSFPVAIDSGSGDLDIPDVSCDGCVPGPTYDASKSSTSQTGKPATFSNTYQTCDLKDPTAPCTIAGNVYSDEVTLAGYGPVRVSFGSITSQTSNFDQFQTIDGVIGFTGGGDQDVFTQLVNAGFCDNIYGLCMNVGSVSNGTLAIGGVDDRLADGDIEYVPNAGLGFSAVTVGALSLGGIEINYGKSAILDTGTNVLLLPSTLMTQLEDAMCADDTLTSCSDLWDGTCLDFSDDEVDAYPDLAMKLDNNVTLTMTARDYILRGSPLASTPSQYCIGIKDGGSAGGSGFIIGDTTMRHYYLVFDRVNDRIGWGPVNTETCGSIL